MTIPSDRLPLYSLVTLSGKDKVNILILVGSAARALLFTFRLFNTKRPVTASLIHSAKITINRETSVADPGCLSRFPDPDFHPSRIPDLGSRIPDPKTARKERGEKKY